MTEHPKIIRAEKFYAKMREDNSLEKALNSAKEALQIKLLETPVDGVLAVGIVANLGIPFVQALVTEDYAGGLPESIQDVKIQIQNVDEEIPNDD